MPCPVLTEEVASKRRCPYATSFDASQSDVKYAALCCTTGCMAWVPTKPEPPTGYCGRLAQ